ncbi:MAG: FimV/HubP family polar landmark protein, partial [Algiphilus sp.]
MSALSRLTLLAAIAFCASAAHAVGLGPVELRSYLNEPLRADIPLRDVDPGALGDIAVGVASDDAYKALGLSRNDYLRHVEASVVLRDGLPTLRLLGDRALREPLIDLLVFVRQGRQSVQRTYTLFIDPRQFSENDSANTDSPDLTARDAPAASSEGGSRKAETPPEVAEETGNASNPVSETPEKSDLASLERESRLDARAESNESVSPNTQSDSATPVESQSLDAMPAGPEPAPTIESSENKLTGDAPQFFETESERQLDPELLAAIRKDARVEASDRKAASSEGSSPQAGETAYRVRRGETLWRIAEGARPRGTGITVEQMMLAIVTSNPAAFEEGDVTRIRANAEIQIPSREKVESIAPSLAKRQMDALVEGASISSLNSTSQNRRSQSVAKPEATDRQRSEPVGTIQDTERSSAGEPPVASSETKETGTSAASREVSDAGSGVATEEPLSATESENLAPALEPIDTAAQDSGTPAETAPVEPPSSEGGDSIDRVGQQLGAPTDPTESRDWKTGIADRLKSMGEAIGQAIRPLLQGTWLGLPWHLVLVALGTAILGVAAIIEMRRRAARRARHNAKQKTVNTRSTRSHDALSENLAEPEDKSSNSPEGEEKARGESFGEGDTLSAASDDDPLSDAEFRIAYGMYDDAAQRLTDAIARDPENATLRLKLAETYCAAGDKERFLDAADAAARSGLSTDEDRELAEMAKRVAPESRFATAIGATLAAGMMLEQEDGDGEPNLVDVRAADDSEQTAMTDTFIGDPSPERAAFDGLTNDSDGLLDGNAEESPGDSFTFDSLLTDDESPDRAAANPSIPVESGATGDASESVDNVLEFDLDALDLGESSSQTVPAGSETAAFAAGNADDHALDFDLDSLEMPEDSASTPTPTPTP